MDIKDFINLDELNDATLIGNKLFIKMTDNRILLAQLTSEQDTGEQRAVNTKIINTRSGLIYEQTLKYSEYTDKKALIDKQTTKGWYTKPSDYLITAITDNLNQLLKMFE